MPFKLGDASNLRFLYACLQTCDFPAIDYHKVAKQFGIQAPAARMRLRRLRDCLEEREGGSKMSKKQTMGDGRRGPRMGKKTGAKEGYEKHWNVVEDDDDDDEDIPLGNLKSRSRESGDGLKKEGREAKEDWRLLPESNPFLPVAAPEARMYGVGAYGAADAKMLPVASSTHQMDFQVQPQMPMYNMAEPCMYSSPQAAMPRMPYYQTSLSDHQTEQHQQRVQYETATPPSGLPLANKQLLPAEEFSGEHFGDSK